MKIGMKINQSLYDEHIKFRARTEKKSGSRLIWMKRNNYIAMEHRSDQTGV